MLENLCPRIDRKCRENATKIPVDSASSLIRRNAASVGGTHAFLWLLIDMEESFSARLKELDEQEERFWNVKHRAPDYFAREIALRLARLFAREIGQKPTVATSGIDGKPSTSFTRALAKTFDVLDVATKPRSAAEWAVNQITEGDLSPPRKPFSRGVGLGMPVQTPATRNVLADLVDASKRPSN